MEPSTPNLIQDQDVSETANDRSDYCLPSSSASGCSLRLLTALPVILMTSPFLRRLKSSSSSPVETSTSNSSSSTPSQPIEITTSSFLPFVTISTNKCPPHSGQTTSSEEDIGTLNFQLSLKGLAGSCNTLQLVGESSH